MPEKNKISSQDYWERNIQGFSGFYDQRSEEDLQGPRLLTYIYKKTVFPLEKKYMKQRFDMVSSYIARNVHPGMSIADVGCGGGIYTKQMASLGAKVYALDFAESALELTRKNLTPDELKNVEFLRQDIGSRPIPSVDIAIAIGVMPYIDKPDSFFNNILPYTNRFLFNFLDAGSWLNMMRHKFPVFDVRGYHYYSVGDLQKRLAQRNFEMTDMKKLATGFVVESKSTKK